MNQTNRKERTMSKKLYEFTTGETGCSYVRCYVWARHLVQAEYLVNEKHPGKTFCERRLLFDEDAPPFASDLSDEGFENRA